MTGKGERCRQHYQSVWLELLAALAVDELQVFFGVCDRLLDQQKLFDELIINAKKQLEHLSLLELFSYLGVLAYQAFAEDGSADPFGQQWAETWRYRKAEVTLCSYPAGAGLSSSAVKIAELLNAKPAGERSFPCRDLCFYGADFLHIGQRGRR